ncbi:hypothetical protein C2845_PM07G39030 [Panicum miliaceum]|uniref:Uncharacterized protein n=1 Tax=Panicum miliaceum TaxID=4540 RepID=A0A3L6SH12_PANMI|nr:hypothetical protein C2845_PM07G39030 [Panicum miliaceum]
MALRSGVLLAVFLLPLGALFAAAAASAPTAATASASAATATASAPTAAATTASASSCPAPHFGHPPPLDMDGPQVSSSAEEITEEEERLLGQVERLMREGIAAQDLAQRPRVPGLPRDGCCGAVPGRLAGARLTARALDGLRRPRRGTRVLPGLLEGGVARGAPCPRRLPLRRALLQADEEGGHSHGGVLLHLIHFPRRRRIRGHHRLRQRCEDRPSGPLQRRPPGRPRHGGTDGGAAARIVLQRQAGH